MSEEEEKTRLTSGTLDRTPYCNILHSSRRITTERIRYDPITQPRKENDDSTQAEDDPQADLLDSSDT